MKIQFGSGLARVINSFLNEVLPPFLRDARWFMKPLFIMAFGRDKADIFMDFREKAPFLSREDLARYYRATAESNLKKDADLASDSMNKVLSCITGQSVLDAGCGRGELLSVLEEYGYKAVGCDMAVGRSVQAVECRLEALPFVDGEFDTVICSHVLEHVPDIRAALKELRRVASQRLIVVLPKERPYRFGFNLHVWFFPYECSVQMLFDMNDAGKSSIADMKGEWLYIEDFDQKK